MTRHIAALGLVAQRRSTRALMGLVMLALLPGTAVAVYLGGPGILMNVLFGCAAACVLEATALRLRSRPARPAIGDGSIVLAAWLLALALPAALPFWQVLVGVAAMVLLGKHVFGGLGHNPFNPAMVGYAVLIISFPQTMTAWLASADTLPATAVALSLGDWFSLKASAGGIVDSIHDGLTAATPLDRLSSMRRDPGLASTLSSNLASDTAALHALMTGSRQLWSNMAFLVGGLWLLWLGVVRWHIPVSILATLAVLHSAYAWWSPGADPAVHLSLLSGAAVLGAFFIATDPVSAATSDGGRLIYGVGIGIICFVIRQFGAFPEGIAFAVLIMNAAVPFIDHVATPARLR